MTSSNGIPAGLEQRGVCNRPAGGGRHAHDLSFTRFGASHLAADQRAVSPVCAGPTEQISPCRSGAISKDPGSHNVVSSRLDVCRQPSRIHSGLFLTRGCVDRALNIFVSRPQPGSYPTDDGTESLHGFEHGGSHDREGVKKLPGVWQCLPRFQQLIGLAPCWSPSAARAGGATPRTTGGTSSPGRSVSTLAVCGQFSQANK